MTFMVTKSISRFAYAKAEIMKSPAPNVFGQSAAAAVLPAKNS
jgi:hypothetical protein